MRTGRVLMSIALLLALTALLWQCEVPETSGGFLEPDGSLDEGAYGARGMPLPQAGEIAMEGGYGFGSYDLTSRAGGVVGGILMLPTGSQAMAAHSGDGPMNGADNWRWHTPATAWPAAFFMLAKPGDVVSPAPPGVPWVQMSHCRMYEQGAVPQGPGPGIIRRVYAMHEGEAGAPMGALVADFHVGGPTAAIWWYARPDKLDSGLLKPLPASEEGGYWRLQQVVAPPSGPAYPPELDQWKMCRSVPCSAQGSGCTLPPGHPAPA